MPTKKATKKRVKKPTKYEIHTIELILNNEVISIHHADKIYKSIAFQQMPDQEFGEYHVQMKNKDLLRINGSRVNKTFYHIVK